MVATALTRVVCEIPRSRRWLILAWTLLLAASAQTVHADVILQGVVTDRDTGAPLAGAKVYLHSSTNTSVATMTDANGEYSIDGSLVASTSGPITFQAVGHFAISTTYDIASVPATLDVDLLGAATPIVRGTVRDAATGQAIAGAQLLLDCAGG